MSTFKLFTDAQEDTPINNVTRARKIACVKLLYILLGFLIFIIGGIVGGIIVHFSGNSSSMPCILPSTISDPQWDPMTETIDPALYGQWQTIIPTSNSAVIGEIIGMQTVHAVLLPSGKTLFASGSSWRNKGPIGTYPIIEHPSAGTGLFNRSDNPFEFGKAESYYSQVNNVGIYDPDQNTFYRLPHPLPIQPDPDNSSWFLPTDLFCTSHQHLKDGNVLFFGGTQFYSPQRTGTKTTHIFNWTKEAITDWNSFDWTAMPSSSSNFYPWQFSGNMFQGRWYPHAVPLLDGRLVIFGGFIGFDGPSGANVTDMYPFEMNSNIEFFDYDVFLRNYNSTNDAWKRIDVRLLPNSPFVTPLPTWSAQGYDCSCNKWAAVSPTTNCSRRCQSYRYDAFKLYPNNYLLPDGRIYLTREGDWNSLRDANASCIRRTNFTYFVSILGNRSNPIVEFSRGPDRPTDVTISGTTILDPNDNQRINLYGGMALETGGTMLPSFFSVDNLLSHNDRYAIQFAGSRGSRKLEEYRLPTNMGDKGSWTMKDTNFLGATLDDDRTMHYAVILPTKQILIINGGNYDLFGSVRSPLLLTPIYSKDGSFSGEYSRSRLATASEDRLYHNVALLISDGRILVGGGNACRATLNVTAPQAISNHTANGQQKPNLERIKTDLYFYTDGEIGIGHNDAPAETWFLEVFLPPYLFIDGNRRVKILNISLIDTPVPQPNRYILKQVLAGKSYYLILSRQTYYIFLNSSNLPDPSSCNTSDSLVLIKLASATHGWDTGQRLYSLPFNFYSDKLQVTIPDAKSNNIAPAFYHMFYVDCRGKPSISIMVRFDDTATSPL